MQFSRTHICDVCSSIALTLSPSLSLPLSLSSVVPLSSLLLLSSMVFHSLSLIRSFSPLCSSYLSPFLPYMLSLSLSTKFSLFFSPQCSLSLPLSSSLPMLSLSPCPSFTSRLQEAATTNVSVMRRSLSLPPSLSLFLPLPLFSLFLCYFPLLSLHPSLSPSPLSLCCPLLGGRAVFVSPRPTQLDFSPVKLCDRQRPEERRKE